MIFLWSNSERISNIHVSTSICGNSNCSRYHLLSINKNPVLIQFPILSINSINRNWIDFQLCCIEHKLDKFISHFSKITNNLYRTIENKYNKKIHWDGKIVDHKIDKVRFSANVSSHCSIFNSKGEKMQLPILTDLKNHAVEFIIQLSKIQVISPFDEDNILYGKILMEIIQIRCHQSIPTRLELYSFSNINSNVKCKEKEDAGARTIECADPSYKKYFDMIKMGVPKKAVEQRIISDGHDICILDGKLSEKKPITKLSMLSGLENCKLKKTKQIERKKTFNQIGFGLGISFEEIQKKLKSLRKTHFL